MEKDDPRRYLTLDAKKSIKGTTVVFHEDEEKYTRSAYVQIYKGYDFLENLMVVRSYIQKRYDIDLAGIELLLKLMGMRIFTIKDYTSIPKDFTYTRFNNMLERGHIQMIQNANSSKDQLYTLSTRAKNLCVNFYQCLSGEKPIPEDYIANPMALKTNQSAFDKKKMKLIKKLNATPSKEHFKKLYS